jgi:hypothetical protein
MPSMSLCDGSFNFLEMISPINKREAIPCATANIRKTAL